MARTRRAVASSAPIIRQRWKHTGRSIVRQRPDPDPPLVVPEPRAAAGPPIAYAGTPEKTAYYTSLGYPKYNPTTVSQGVVGRLTRDGTTVAYVVQPGDTPSSIAQTFQVSVDTLLAANPELGTGERLLTGQVIAIPVSEATFPPEPRTLIPYVAQTGDSLSTIAQAFRIPLDDLVRVNPQIGPDGGIFVGQVIWIPTVTSAPPSQLSVILFVAQPGDTLGDIGLRFNVTLEEMVAANPQMQDSELLYPGEIVVVPVSGIPGHPLFRRRRYVVQPGDTVLSIATQYMVTIEALQNANPVLLAIPGLVLRIPEGVPIPEPPKPDPDARPCRRPPFGRRLELGDDEAVFVPFGREFRFAFFGQTYTGLFVSSNGNVTFGEGDPTFFASVDQFLEGPPRIAPFWVDLNPPGGVAGSGVYVDIEENRDPTKARFVVTWDRVPYFFTEQANTVQLSLFGDGLIQICYFSVANPPDPRRILVGVARGLGEPESNIFRYDTHSNPRRTGSPSEPTPAGSLSGRILRYVYNEETRDYRLAFTE